MSARDTRGGGAAPAGAGAGAGGAASGAGGAASGAGARDAVAPLERPYKRALEVLAEMQAAGMPPTPPLPSVLTGHVSSLLPY
jgi:hypothetical protein